MMTSARCAISSGFFARDAALIVLAVAQQNDGAARGHRPFVDVHQLVAAGIVDGVIHRGAAAGAQHAHAVGKRFGVVGEILRDFGRGVEADDKSLS